MNMRHSELNKILKVLRDNLCINDDLNNTKILNLSKQVSNSKPKYQPMYQDDCMMTFHYLMLEIE